MIPEKAPICKIFEGPASKLWLLPLRCGVSPAGSPSQAPEPSVTSSTDAHTHTPKGQRGPTLQLTNRAEMPTLQPIAEAS